MVIIIIIIPTMAVRVWPLYPGTGLLSYLQNSKCYIYIG